jgi:hypothetical protein
LGASRESGGQRCDRTKLRHFIKNDLFFDSLSNVKSRPNSCRTQKKVAKKNASRAREEVLNVRVKGAVVKRVSSVSLKRIADGALFRITAPCVLRLREELVHVIGEPQEELDTDVWDTTQKFEVVFIQPPNN